MIVFLYTIFFWRFGPLILMYMKLISHDSLFYDDEIILKKKKMLLQ